MAAAFGVTLVVGCAVGWIAASLVIAAANAAHNPEDDR